MTFIQHSRQLIALFAGLLLIGQVFAAPAPAEELKEFKELSNPLATESGKKIEVVEFFWYRCPHCNHLEPALSAWAKKLPADVVLRTVPAVFNEKWAPAAKLHYALIEMGALKNLHDKAFDAYHKEKINLDDEGQLMAWVRRQGLDETKFKTVYDSFSTQSQVLRGAQAARAAGIDGVPALLVNGKYLTSVSMTGTEERLFEVLDDLIQRERKTSAKIKPRRK